MRPRTFLKMAVTLLLACGAPAAAQEQLAPPSSQVERKNLAPVSKDILRVRIPKAVEKTLSNGLTVLIIEDHRLPWISVRYNLGGAGPLYEPAGMPGLAGITAQMMREGTKTRTSLQIAEAIEGLGASLSVSSAFGSSAAVLTASGLSDNFEQWFALANDVLLNPSFPANELERTKQRLRVTLRQQRTSSGFLMSERFNRAVYGDYPAANISATPATIDAITPEILARWHRDRYAPQNAILGLAGDVKPAEIVPKLERWLAQWKRTDVQEVLPTNPRAVSSRKVYLVDRPDSVQTSLILGNIAIDRRDPDYLALVATNYVLGGGSGSRLFLNLREEKGYTYGAYSTFTALKYPGPWSASAEVRTEVTDGALAEFIREIQRIRDTVVSRTELEDAKRAIVASFALSLEEPAQLLNYAITRKIYGFPEDYWDTYPVKLMAVTAADVQRVARKYYDPSNMQIVAVGDGAKIVSVLQKYGPLERYDIEGKKLP